MVNEFDQSIGNNSVGILKWCNSMQTLQCLSSQYKHDVFVITVKDLNVGVPLGYCVKS